MLPVQQDHANPYSFCEKLIQDAPTLYSFYKKPLLVWVRVLPERVKVLLGPVNTGVWSFCVVLVKRLYEKCYYHLLFPPAISTLVPLKF